MDETHPLSLGWVGMHGWKHVNRAMPVGRPADRPGHALRRPRYRPRADVRAVRADHPRGHRPGRDRAKNVAVEIPIVGDVKRVSDGPAALVPARAAWNRRAARPISPSWRNGGRVRKGALARVRGLAQRPALGRLRGLQDRRGHQPRRHDRRRRGPEPDVGRTLRRVPPAEQPHQLGRSGHDGVRIAGANGAAMGGRTRKPGQSSATGACK